MSETTLQAQELDCWLATRSPQRSGDEIADVSKVPEDPVKSFVQNAMEAHAGVPEEFRTSDDSLTKRHTGIDQAQFITNRCGISGPFGSAAALHSESLGKRTEVRQAGANTWQYSYDARGELIDAHVVNDDGGRLEKRSDPANLDFSDIDADAQIHAQRLNKLWRVDDPESLET